MPQLTAFAARQVRAECSACLLLRIVYHFFFLLSTLFCFFYVTNKKLTSKYNLNIPQTKNSSPFYTLFLYSKHLKCICFYDIITEKPWLSGLQVFSPIYVHISAVLQSKITKYCGTVAIHDTITLCYNNSEIYIKVYRCVCEMPTNKIN